MENVQSHYGKDEDQTYFLHVAEKVSKDSQGKETT